MRKETLPDDEDGKKTLSVFMDGELRGVEFDVCLARLGDDPRLRETWDIYHLIGDALRSGEYSPLPGARPRPMPRTRPLPAMSARPLAAWHSGARRALYAAAGLAAIAFVAWVAAPMLRPAPPAPAVPAPLAENEPVQPAAGEFSAADLDNYLFAHQPYTHFSAMQGVVPYVRTVSDPQERPAR